MKRFRKTFKFWFAWDPEKIESYLEDMSLQGWHMAYADGFLVNFMFEQGEPKRISYCVDYQNQERDDYKQIFVDDGWRLLQKSLGWYIWSKEYEGERPSIYTDVDSLIVRNRNILMMVAAVFVTQVPMIVINTGNFIHIVQSSLGLGALLLVFLAVVYFLLAYCIVKLTLSINKLRKKRR